MGPVAAVNGIAEMQFHFALEIAAQARIIPTFEIIADRQAVS
jgi:hypothetical protein